GAMEVERVAIPGVSGRKDHWRAVQHDAEMADQTRIEQLVQLRPVRSGAFAAAADGTSRCGGEHGVSHAPSLPDQIRTLEWPIGRWWTALKLIPHLGCPSHRIHIVERHCRGRDVPLYTCAPSVNSPVLS